MTRAETFRFLIVTMVIAPSLMASDMVPPGWMTSPEGIPGGEREAVEPVAEAVGGKRQPREFRVLEPKKPKIDLRLGGALFYDSNPRLAPKAEGSAVSSVDLGFRVERGKESEMGGYYDLDYALTAFRYEDSSLSPGGNDLDHRFRARIGLNRSRTRFRLSSSYARNSGQTVDINGLSREIRAEESDDFAFAFAVARDLPHGSLEATVGSYLYAFRDSALNDGNGVYADLAWYYTPGFAPKTDVGIGFRFGSDNYDGLMDQRFLTPSFRWRYRMSGKTTIHSTIGYEERRLDRLTKSTTENLVYNGGITWAPSTKTSVDLAVGRRVSPSFDRGNGDYEATDLVLRIHKRLGKKFVLTGTAGYETANYFAATNPALSGREDSFFKSGVNLAHPVHFGSRIEGEVDVFYSYNQNDSTIEEYEFEQHVSGVRFGLQY